FADDQTLVFADPGPMKHFLEGNARPKPQTQGPGAPAAGEKPPGGGKAAPGGDGRSPPPTRGAAKPPALPIAPHPPPPPPPRTPAFGSGAAERLLVVDTTGDEGRPRQAGETGQGRTHRPPDRCRPDQALPRPAGGPGPPGDGRQPRVGPQQPSRGAGFATGVQ